MELKVDHGILRTIFKSPMAASLSKSLRCFSVSLTALTLQACNLTPYQPPTPQPVVVPGPGSIDPQLPPQRTSDYQPGVGSEIVIRAISLLGAPYKWGGNGPGGFDCSGLVKYVHNEMGIAVPRTAAEQYHAATPVDVDDLEPGDLLFFRIRGRKVSHVAIYAGSGRFVHAPQTGRPIEIRALDDGYYRPRLAAAGRLF